MASLRDRLVEEDLLTWFGCAHHRSKLRGCGLACPYSPAPVPPMPLIPLLLSMMLRVVFV